MDTVADHLAEPAQVGAAPLLGPELTIPHAAVLREQLLLALALADAPGGDGGTTGARPSAEGLVLDLSGVSDCDSSGVQLLLATRASLAQRGQTLQLRSPSAAVREALATFGLGSLWAAPGSASADAPGTPAAVATH